MDIHAPVNHALTAQDVVNTMQVGNYVEGMDSNAYRLLNENDETPAVILGELGYDLLAGLTSPILEEFAKKIPQVYQMFSAVANFINSIPVTYDGLPLEDQNGNPVTIGEYYKDAVLDPNDQQYNIFGLKTINPTDIGSHAKINLGPYALRFLQQVFPKFNPDPYIG